MLNVGNKYYKEIANKMDVSKIFYYLPDKICELSYVIIYMY